jgi:LmbE family N-acetylglucosaminyl deacetylase
MSNRATTVLAICAHPDDAEFSCAGTLLLLRTQGWDIHIATMTCGNCGSVEHDPNTIARTRRSEADAAHPAGVGQAIPPGFDG